MGTSKDGILDLGTGPRFSAKLDGNASVLVQLQEVMGWVNNIVEGSKIASSMTSFNELAESNTLQQLNVPAY